MKQEELINNLRSMRYWQKHNKENPSSIGLVRQKQLEDLIDIYLESH